KFVKPAIVTTMQAGAHYAVSSLFKEDEQSHSHYRYNFELEEYERRDLGFAELAVGGARVTSEITPTSHPLSFGVLHCGDHNLSAGVIDFRTIEAHRAMAREVIAAFERADYPAVLRLLDKYFGGATYSFKSLFKDEQRYILEPIMADAIGDAE